MLLFCFPPHADDIAQLIALWHHAQAVAVQISVHVSAWVYRWVKA